MTEGKLVKYTGTTGNYFEGNFKATAEDLNLHFPTKNKYLDSDIYINIEGASSSLDPAVINATTTADTLTAATDSISKVNPKLTIKESGTFFTETGFGITTTKPSSGKDGTNYLTINEDHSAVTAGSATSTWKVNKSAATYTTEAGYLPTHDTSDLQTLFGAKTLEGGQSNTNISVDVTDDFEPYYIPIVSVSGGGGALSATEDSVTVTTNPVVTVSETGTFTSTGKTSYGVTTTKPSGEDGTAYLTVDGSASVTTTGVATSSWTASRGTVTYTNSAGAITSHSGTTLSGLATSTKNGGTTADITPTITDNFEPYYIPVVSVSGSGGGLSAASDNVSGDAGSVTIEETGSFTTTGKTSYGVTTTKPSGEDGTAYLTVDATGTAANGSITSTWKVNRAAVKYTNGAGAIAAHSETSLSGLATSSLEGGATKTITPTVTDNFEPYYIPIVSVSGGGGGLTATANYSATPSTTVSGTLSTGLTGITTQTTAPATGTKYITITGSSPKLTGTTTVSRGAVTYTNSAGAITSHSGTTLSLSAASTCSPSVTVNAASETKYLVLPTGSIFKASKEDSTATGPYAGYAEITNNVTVDSEGYLIIQKGWYETNQKISLATIVPNDADIPYSTSSPFILDGKSAYDKDGKLITGGILTFDGTYHIDCECTK